MKKESRLFFELYRDLKDETSGFQDNKVHLLFNKNSERSLEFLNHNIERQKMILRKAEDIDFEKLLKLDNLCFGKEEYEDIDEKKNNFERVNSEENENTDEEKNEGLSKDTFNKDAIREKELAEIDGATYIAEMDGIMVGKVDTLSQVSDGYIYGFCIAEEYRRKGLGISMAQLILEEFINIGITDVLLEVDKKNFAALELYKQCGFVEITKQDLI